ncbi:MAG: Cof-type HAD-IIB family hydrolase [Eubacteriales bacterium]
MISLIAVDMDGTLLNSEGLIPSHFQEIFDRLEEKNILFAVASGRQYGNLLENFYDLRDRIVFIAENGTCVIYQGKTLYLNPIPMADVLELCAKGRTIPNSAMVVCGRKSAYIEKSSDKEREQFNGEITKYYTKMETVNSFADIDDDILKFTVCTFEGAEAMALPAFQSFLDRFSVVVSGEFWLDISQPGANKGVALAHVQNYFGITRDQTMAFGDFMNDVELLQNADYSYAMANSHPDLFQHANFQAAANYEDGVLRQIVHMLDNPSEYEKNQ